MNPFLAIMSDSTETQKQDTTGTLASGGYLPAIAAKHLAAGEYSRVVEICKQHLESYRHLLSINLLYARALFHAGQFDSAEEQFYIVLARDPDNIVALKHLGDIRFSRGDEMAAMANYRRVLEIDPSCHGLKMEIHGLREQESTHTIKLVKREPRAAIPQKKREKTVLAQIKFYTETMGDLYLTQGHARLASEVFESLLETNNNPRISEKLAAARRKKKEKEENECQ